MMPLLVMTGYPSSGKTTRVTTIVDFFLAKYPDLKIVVVNDEQFTGFDREKIFSSSHNEKNHRAYLKSEAQKSLNKDTLVIIDALNYIKGYRYELFCVTKSAQTPHAVLWCDVGKVKALEMNATKPDHEQYSEKLMNELIMRYEEPNGQARWDSPLFMVQADGGINMEDLDAALFKSKAPPPNLSTVAQPLQPTNFMYELDRVTNEVVKHVISSQRQMLPGEKIRVPDAGEIQLHKHCTMAELNKIRRQFITYMKMNPLTDCSKLSSMFVQYLQTALQ